MPSLSLVAILDEPVVGQISIVSYAGTRVETIALAPMAIHPQTQRQVDYLSHTGVVPLHRIGIGMHAGEVVTANTGNDARKQYSINGTPVIIAARLEQLNQELGTQFLVSGQMHQSLLENELYSEVSGSPRASMGLMRVKEIGEQVKVLRVA